MHESAPIRQGSLLWLKLGLSICPSCALSQRAAADVQDASLCSYTSEYYSTQAPSAIHADCYIASLSFSFPLLSGEWKISSPLKLVTAVDEEESNLCTKKVFRQKY